MIGFKRLMPATLWFLISGATFCQGQAQASTQSNNPLFFANMNLLEEFDVCPSSVTYQKSYVSVKAGYNKSTFWAPSIGRRYTLQYAVVQPDGTKVLYTCHAETAHPTALVNFGHISVFERAVATDANPSSVPGATSDSTVTWNDTLFVGGLPVGTPVQIEVTFHLTSWMTVSQTVGTTVECGIHLNSSVSTPGNYVTATQTIPCSSPQLNYENTQVLSTTAGMTVSLENALSVFATMQNAGADLDVIDAYISLQLLTPGATMVSASGVQY
jgi:hypothetical protein